MHRFHFSVDDVFWSVLQLSDWDLPIARQPMLGFLDGLHRDTGLVSDLYLFQQGHASDGRQRRLSDIGKAAAAALRTASGLRFGPHALDYQTAPYAQSMEQAGATMQTLLAEIHRFTLPSQRSDWVRLHYFSELFELGELWRQHGISALLTTDKPARCYRLPAAQKGELGSTGKTRFSGTGFMTSHLRLEFFLNEADDPARFCARIDAAYARHGFVTVFTHEDDLNDPRCRTLLRAASDHAVKTGLL